MRSLRCPRCQTIAAVRDGQPPACGACGFGAAAAPTSQDAPARSAEGVPVGIAAPAPPEAPERGIDAPAPADRAAAGTPASPRRTGLVVASLLVGVLLLAGLAAGLVYGLADDDGISALSEQESRERVESALAGLAGDIADGGRIQTMAGTLEIQEAEWFGTMDISFTIEWGTGGAMHADLAMRQPGVTIEFAFFCTPERTITVFGDVAVEERSRGEACSLDEAQDAEVFTLEDLSQDGVEVVEVTPHADGTVTATVANGTQTGTVQLDALGRITHMTMADEEVTGDISFSYGPRRAIEMPADAVRAPADVYGSGNWSDGVYEWEAWWGDDVPLSEFEVRVLDGITPVATFPLDGGATSVDGIAFAFEDRDADGMLSSGDGFTVEAGRAYDVLVWDTWADRSIDDDVAAPGAHWLLALAGLGAVALRRR